MKKIAAIWVILAAAYAIVATLLYLEPAATLIDLSVGSDGRYMIVIPVGITFILLMLPFFIVMFINNLIQGKKNKMPADLTNKTGIVVERSKELTNAALMYEVWLNGEQKSKVAMGKKIFIELTPGDYELQIKLGNKIYSRQLPVRVEHNKILAFQTKMDMSKSLTTLVAKGEMLFLVQIPVPKP